MKATGIIRKIDELGRIVIPKEIRKTMQIASGDSVEIFTQPDETIILKKYSVLKDFEILGMHTAKSVFTVCKTACALIDRDSVVCIAGGRQKDEKQKISEALREKITSCKNYQLERQSPFLKLTNDANSPNVIALEIITANGECAGALALLDDAFASVSSETLKALETAAAFLGAAINFE